MSKLNNQITVTALYDIGVGNLIPVRRKLAEIFEMTEAGISAFQIDKIRLISYGLAEGNRQTVIPGEGILSPVEEGRAGTLAYQFTGDDGVNLFLTYHPRTQTVKVDRTDTVVDVELAITIIEREFKPSGDGYLHIAIPVRADFANGHPSSPAIMIEHGSFKEDNDLIKGTWGMEHGSFEPAFDAKGNIISFNLINKS